MGVQLLLVGGRIQAAKQKVRLANLAKCSSILDELQGREVGFLLAGVHATIRHIAAGVH